jgi:hypothetical protein
MILSDSELREISERCSAATPGKWEAGKGSEQKGWIETSIGTSRPIIIQTSAHADAVFIAASRSDIPRLLETIEVLKRALTMCAKNRNKIADLQTLQRSPEDHWIKKAEGAQK